MGKTENRKAGTMYLGQFIKALMEHKNIRITYVDAESYGQPDTWVYDNNKNMYLWLEDGMMACHPKKLMRALIDMVYNLEVTYEILEDK